MLLMIDNYDSFTFNLYQFLGELGAYVLVRRNDKITITEIEEMLPKQIIISPGPCTPNESGISLKVIERFAGEIPILGVCLGHQAIGQVFGGRVVRAGRLMHGKTSEIFHQGRGVFAGLSNPFTATRYHSLLLERQSLPNCLEITAETDQGEIMGIKHNELEIEGVQFHPESILTREGKNLLKNFLASAANQSTANHKVEVFPKDDGRSFGYEKGRITAG